MTNALLSGLTLGALLGLCATSCSSTDDEAREPAGKASATVPAPLGPLEGSAYDAGLRVLLPKVPPAEEHGLHNVYRLSDDIVSGSEPHGPEALRELQAMGIRTILSVDGKAPDAQFAEGLGMRYVHVPIQYKGITEDEVMRIAKTFREQEGPFYVHCFHGKHRGPAAAEIGRIVLDGIQREKALAEMRQWCGTSASYEGLYQTIAEGEIPSEAQTRAYDWDFPSAHPFEGFRAAMVEVSRADDNLKALSKNGWQPDPEHPDVDALNEATKLADLMARSNALPEVAAEPQDFHALMTESVAASAALRDALRAWKEAGGPADAADKAYKRTAASCSACHDVYRN